MSKAGEKAKRTAELQLALETVPVPLSAARRWLEETEHRAGCQCHRCHWAHGVIAGRIRASFEEWRKRS